MQNLLDVTCVGVTAALGLLLGGQVLGVGVGTLASMLLTDWVIAGINRAFRQPMRRLAGLEPLVRESHRPCKIQRERGINTEIGASRYRPRNTRSRTAEKLRQGGPACELTV